MRYFSFVLLCLLVINFSLLAQWQQGASPQAGFVSDVVRVDGELWATTTSGLFSSSNDGISWIKNEQVDAEYLSGIDLIDGVIYIPCNKIKPYNYRDYQLGFYKSEDNGLSWDYFEVLGQGVPGMAGIKIYKIENRYFLNYGGYLFKSLNPENYWEAVSFDITIAAVSHGHDGDNLIASTHEGLMISTDLGDNWNIIDTVVCNQEIYLEGDLIILPMDSTILVSQDLGENWVEHNLELSSTENKVRKGENGKLYLIGKELYESDDNGVTWLEIEILENEFIYEILQENPSSIILATTKGLRKSVESGQNWTDISGEIQPSGVREIYFSPSNEIFIETGYSVGTFGNFRSSNDGYNWVEWAKPEGESTSNGLSWIGETAFLLTYSGLYRSTDNLQTYENILPLEAPSYSHRITIDGDDLYLLDPANSTILKSSDLGSSWEIIGQVEVTSPYKINSLSFSNGIMLLAVNDGTIRKSSDNGATWDSYEFASSGFALGWVSFHKIENRTILVGTSSSIYTDDDGLTWQVLLEEGLPFPENGTSPRIAPENLTNVGSLLFASLKFHGVYFSVDKGETWQTYNDGLANLRANSLNYQDGLFLYGTRNSGLWKKAANFLTTSGTVFNDLNGDGVHNIGEPPISNAIVGAEPLGYYTTTSSDGNYFINVEELNDSIKVFLETAYATVNPETIVVDSNSSDNDFAVNFIPNKNDLCITAGLYEHVRPGFDNKLLLQVKNVGTTVQSPMVNLLIPNDFHSISIIPENGIEISDHFFSWDLGQLAPFESVNIEVSFTASTSLEIGDILFYQNSVFPSDNDENPSNNIFILTEEVVGSFDPNDKSVSPEFLTPEDLSAGEQLNYKIRFQNTGNYLAENVRITDTLSTNLDLSTLTDIVSSHSPFDWHIRDGRILEFVFHDIMLPDSISNEPESHGFVQFKIKPKHELEIGDEILNNASIYFDFNSPIITNTTSSLISQVNSIVQIVKQNKLSVDPNPSSGELLISLPTNANGSGILEIYSIEGKFLKSQTVYIDNGSFKYEVSFPSTGQYILKLSLGKKEFRAKVLGLKNN